MDRFRFASFLCGFSLLGCAAAPSSPGGGGTGGTTTSSGPTMKSPSTYAQNAASGTATYPFPQGHAYPNCTWPKYNTDSVETAYQNWKMKFFDTSRAGSCAPRTATTRSPKGSVTGC